MMFCWRSSWKRYCGSRFLSWRCLTVYGYWSLLLNSSNWLYVCQLFSRHSLWLYKYPARYSRRRDCMSMVAILYYICPIMSLTMRSSHFFRKGLAQLWELLVPSQIIMSEPLSPNSRIPLFMSFNLLSFIQRRHVAAARVKYDDMLQKPSKRDMEQIGQWTGRVNWKLLLALR